MKRRIDRSAELEKAIRLGTTANMKVTCKEYSKLVKEPRQQKLKGHLRPFARDALHGYLPLKKALDFADHLNDRYKRVGPIFKTYWR